jgi:uncharacterized MnhB-related membrane protein
MLNGYRYELAVAVDVALTLAAMTTILAIVLFW